MSSTSTPFAFSSPGRILAPSALETASSASWMMTAFLMPYSLAQAATTGLSCLSLVSVLRNAHLLKAERPGFEEQKEIIATCKRSSRGAMISNSELKHGPETARTLSRSASLLMMLRPSDSLVWVS